MSKHNPTEHALDTRANKEILLGYARHTKGYRDLMSPSPVHIVETMHVTLAEDSVNSPNLLLCLPDKEGQCYCFSYPDRDEAVVPLIPPQEPMPLPKPAQGVQENELPLLNLPIITWNYQRFSEKIISLYLNINTKNSSSSCSTTPDS